MRAFLQTVASAALNSTPFPKSHSAPTPLSSLGALPVNPSFLSERPGFFLLLRRLSLLSFYLCIFCRDISLNTELEAQHLTRCSEFVAFLLTAPDMSVQGRSCFVPPTLCSLETVRHRSPPLKYNLP